MPDRCEASVRRVCRKPASWIPIWRRTPPRADCRGDLQDGHNTLSRNGWGAQRIRLRCAEQATVGARLRRGLELLTAWSANRNEIVSFYAAMGLRQSDPGRSAEALKKLYETGSAAMVEKVKDLMDDWGIT